MGDTFAGGKPIPKGYRRSGNPQTEPGTAGSPASGDLPDSRPFSLGKPTKIQGLVGLANRRTPFFRQKGLANRLASFILKEKPLEPGSIIKKYLFTRK